MNARCTVVLLAWFALPLRTSLAVAAPQCAPPTCTPAPCAQNVICTLFGGFASDRVQGVYPLNGPSNAGNILVCGETSSNFLDASLPWTTTAPIQHPFATPLATSYDSALNTSGSADGFVAILDPAMTHVLYWTYLGGDGEDRVYAAAEDAQGNIWVCGYTNSLGAPQSFPSNLCYKEPGWSNCTPPSGWTWAANGSYDAFVVQLPFNLSGSLLSSTVIGGSGWDHPRGTITVGGQPLGVYISGSTQSANFPVSTGAPAPHSSTGNTTTICSTSGLVIGDAFVVRLNSNGQLIWSRCLGGSGDDTAWGNARIDYDGDVFIGGCTRSSTLISATTPGGFDFGASIYGALSGAADGFVAKFAGATGKALALRFHGGSGTDWVAFNDCLELDGTGRPVVTGLTRSFDFPLAGMPLSTKHSNDPALGADLVCPTSPAACGGTPPTFDCDPNSNDEFVAKFKNDLSAVLYSSYVNQVPGYAAPTACYREECAGLAIERTSIFISGETDSPGFPIAGNALDATISCAVAPPCGNYHDAFFLRMFAGTSTPSVLHYSTFFGGSTGSPMASEPGNRARCIDIIRSGSRAGMPVFCGATTMTDFAAITTPSVLFPNWFLPGGGTDNRTGFIAVHDAN